jgi:virginiamycin B lyase
VIIALIHPGNAEKKMLIVRTGFICFTLLIVAEHSVAQILDDYPEGPAKSIIVERCGICHTLRNVRSGDNDTQGWRETLYQMQNMGAALDDDEIDLLTAYLTINSPPSHRPDAVTMPGEVQISYTEWNVDTRGSMPRDVAVAPDGKFWFSATFASTLIEVDPEAGTLTEHRLRPYSAPMGVAVDAKGDIWFASSRRAYLGKLVPATGNIDYFAMPDGGPPDPSDLIIDRAGLVWFTAQDGNIVGRLDPQTGDLVFVEMPRDEATPFALALAPGGDIFVGLRDSKSILRIDAESLETREYPLTGPETEPRRLAITDDGIVWYTDVDRGNLGRLDPETGVVTEFSSPSGPRSDPHGIVSKEQIVWYVETNASPNQIVRFDTRSESFQSWPLSGFGVVRDLAVTEDGGLAYAMGSLNRVGLISVEE